MYGTEEGDKAKGTFAFCLWKSDSVVAEWLGRSILWLQAVLVLGTVLYKAKKDEFELSAIPETTTWFIYVAGIAYFIGTFLVCYIPSFGSNENPNADIPYWILFVLLNACLSAL